MHKWCFTFWSNHTWFFEATFSCIFFSVEFKCHFGSIRWHCVYVCSRVCILYARQQFQHDAIFYLITKNKKYSTFRMHDSPSTLYIYSTFDSIYQLHIHTNGFVLWQQRHRSSHAFATKSTIKRMHSTLQNENTVNDSSINEIESFVVRWKRVTFHRKFTCSAKKKIEIKSNT